MFLFTKERVKVTEAYHSNMWSDLKDLIKNDQWRIVAGFTILNILAVSVRGGAMMYYVTYILGNVGYFAVFLGTYSVGNLLGSALAKPVTDHICKVRVFGWTNLILAVISFVMFWIPIQSVVMMFIFVFFIGILHQMITPIQWVMMSDTVEYGEWKSGKRLTGISFSGILFVFKTGISHWRGFNWLGIGWDQLSSGGSNTRKCCSEWNRCFIYYSSRYRLFP